MAFYCNGKMGVCEYNEEDRNCAECAYVDGTGGREIPDAPKLQTNADRIRAMSDEELAELTQYTGCPDPHLPCGESTCYECRLNWLRQPVKDGEGK